MLGPPISNPPNPWASSEVEYLGEPPRAPVVVHEDGSRAILSRNRSPDLGFTYTVNPYRGCLHGCAYCYARRYHEYLGFGAGTDFETRLVVKPAAPALLRAAFERRSWQGDKVMFSGATDCYQPLEASYRLTRGCLEVCAAYRNPVGIVTKAPLVERDLDVLAALAREARVRVWLSVPLWDAARARAIEPHVATPQRRMKTVARLAAAGIPVGVLVCPLIPGLGEDDLGPLLEAARAAGADRASWALLRLPGPVKPVFEERLRAALPMRADKVLRRVREARRGVVEPGGFGVRLRGEGSYAESLAALFDAACRRVGLDGADPDTPTGTTFRRPEKSRRQLALF